MDRSNLLKLSLFKVCLHSPEFIFGNYSPLRLYSFQYIHGHKKTSYAPALHTWANPHTHYRLHFCCPHNVYAPFLDHWGHRHLITAIIDDGNMDFPCPNNVPHQKISSCPHNIISRCNSALSHACQHTVSNVALHSVLDAISIKLSVHVGVKFVVTPYDCMSMLLLGLYIG